MWDSVSDLLFGPVFDIVDIGLVVIDGDGRVVAWNDWMARISRRPASHVLGQPLFDIFPDARNTRMPGVIRKSMPVTSSGTLRQSCLKMKN